MSSQAVALATPTQSNPPPAAPTPPGSWTHPRFAEIGRRQQASRFDSGNIKRISLLCVFFVATFAIPRLLSSWTDVQKDFPNSAWVFFSFRLYILFAIYLQFKPLWTEDTMEDIPLTPNQRALLGLGPSSRPDTPGSDYITPPRYTKTTPRSTSSRAALAGSSPFRRSVSGSPIAGSPLAGRGVGTGSFSSSANGSPYVRKAVGKRWSLGGESVFGMPSTGLEESSTSLPATPSPTGQRGVSVSLNNKWLYQKQKEKAASPGSRYL